MPERRRNISPNVVERRLSPWVETVMDDVVRPFTDSLARGFLRAVSPIYRAGVKLGLTEDKLLKGTYLSLIGGIGAVGIAVGRNPVATTIITALSLGIGYVALKVCERTEDSSA